MKGQNPRNVWYFNSFFLPFHVVVVQVIGTLRLEYEYDFLNLVRMLSIIIRGTKRLVSENICSVVGNSAAIFVS